jgi:hypothetical protein
MREQFWPSRLTGLATRTGAQKDESFSQETEALAEVGLQIQLGQ